MSDMSQGPGWWIASDGKWYPPHLHPSVRIPEPPAVEGDFRSPETHTVVPTGEMPASGAGWPVGPSPTRRSRRPVALLASVVAIVVIVVGAETIFGSTESASAKVVDAATSTLNDGTAHLTISLTGNSAGTSVTGTGSGDIDFTDNALHVQMTVGADGQRVPIQAVYQGGKIYESIPGLNTVVPGKSWVSIDLSSLGNLEAQDPSAGGLGSNPSVTLQMLAQQGNTVVPLGPSTVDGVAVDGYSVTVNPARAEQELKKAKLPAWMQQAVAGLQVHDIVLKVYVDKAGLLRAFSTQVSETTDAAGSVAFGETLDFSDYGHPVTVTAPPASQVEGLQQLLQAAGASGSASVSGSASASS